MYHLVSEVIPGPQYEKEAVKVTSLPLLSYSPLKQL